MLNAMYSAGAPELVIWMRKYVEIAEIATNTKDAIAEKVAIVLIIFRFFIEFCSRPLLRVAAAF